MKYNYLSAFLAIFGEAIILACFLLFGESSNAKWLCFAVTSIVYFLWLGQGLIPWLNLKDKANRKVGSLGIVWLGISIYSVLAIFAMLACNLVKPLAVFVCNSAEPLGLLENNVPFEIQLIIHCILLFILLFILLLGKGAANKVANIYEKENALVESRDSVKQALSSLKRKIAVKNDFPNWILERISKMDEEARFISPNNSSAALELDRQFLESLKKLETKIDFNNLEQIETDECLKFAELTLTERKRVLN